MKNTTLLAALITLVERVEHYAPEMGRNGDLDEARAAIAFVQGCGCGCLYGCDDCNPDFPESV